MRTHHIRLDAGQSHFAWFDKGSQLIVLDGALAVTLRHGGLDWLPDAPRHIRRLLDEGECLTLETAGHVALSASGAGAVSTAVVEPASRSGWLVAWRAILRRLSGRMRRPSCTRAFVTWKLAVVSWRSVTPRHISRWRSGATR